MVTKVTALKVKTAVKLDFLTRGLRRVTCVCSQPLVAIRGTADFGTSVLASFFSPDVAAW